MHSLFLKAVGWALLNSLWQYGLLWIIFLVTSSAKKLAPALRHCIALFLSITGIIWFITDFLLEWYHLGSSGTGLLDSYIAASDYASAFTTIQQSAGNYLIYITSAYLLITGVQFIKFAYFFHQSHLLHTAGISKAQVELRLYVQKMALQLNIKRSVQVFISEFADTPLVIGFIKPTILMPLACINQLTLSQLEAILLHELAHIKRNDYLVNIYVAAMEIIFFFNPFARLLLQCIKNEREHSCDDRVMQHQFSPHLYASALLTLEKNRTGYLPAGIAATGASRRILLYRVQRIMKVQGEENTSTALLTAFVAACCLICLLACLRPVVKHSAYDYNNQLYSLVSKLPFNRHQTVQHPSVEQQAKISNGLRAKTAVIPKAAKQVKPHRDNDFLFPVSVSDEISNLPILEALTMENRNYSIPDNVQPELPPAARVEGFPYVPSSSFYYFSDTAKPTIKGETYHERNARESLLKAKKALNQINWTDIQKRLHSRVNIATLRKEIEQSIARLNWQQINEEVKDSINQQTLKNEKSILFDEYTQMNTWKTHQQQLENMQNQLKLQQKSYQLDAESKTIELQKQLSKYKIVVYL